jgi:hypothetical protein
MTEPIFEQLAIVNKQAKDDPTILRLSLDAKATVKVGEFSRGGKTRAEAEGNDHDFKPKAKVTPSGIFLPELDELFYYLTTSKVTSDFMVDVLESWWLEHYKRFPQVKTLLLNQDNGPENHRCGKLTPFSPYSVHEKNCRLCSQTLPKHPTSLLPTLS